MLSCVVNLSEGRDRDRLEVLRRAAGPALLDVHTDSDHHRSVFTLGALEDGLVEESALALVEAALEQLDVTTHGGVHPRLGVADVVPFVPLLPGASLAELAAADLGEAVAARDRFARRVADRLGLPAFRYGPLEEGNERSLPEVRRHAFAELAPDHGGPAPHPTGGAVCVGARRCLVAYNLLLETAELDAARAIARGLRSDAVRALAFPVAGRAQVSCNLVAPWKVGPLQVYEAVADQAQVAACELVGLLPRSVVAAVPGERRELLALGPGVSLESRLGLG